MLGVIAPRIMDDFPSKDDTVWSEDSGIHDSRMPIWKQVLLWIAVLPGALFGSTITFWIMGLFSWLGSSRFGDDSWFYYIWRQIMTNGLCGAAFVYCAGYIAPKGKIATSITFAALTLLLSSLSFFTSINRREWMSVLGIVCLNAGAIITAVSVARGETSFER